MMYYFTSAAWLVITTMSWSQGNRRLPLALLLLGALVQAAIWMIGVGYWGVAALAVLTIIGMFSVPEIFFRN